MQTPTRTIAIALSALALGAAAPATAFAYPGHSLSRQAHLSITRARAIALAARPGKIVAEELEREGGGSGLRYSFDIRAAGLVYEVGVDANTGAVLENVLEGAHPD